MDIISEILETDNLAEKKISDADMQSREIIENADRECSNILAESEKKIEKYRQIKKEQTDEKIKLQSLKARSETDSKIKNLDKLFDENGEHWAKDITDRILNSEN